MNKKQELVGKFLAGNLEGTQLLMAFKVKCKESIQLAEELRVSEEATLQKRCERYDPETIASSERSAPAEEFFRSKKAAEDHLQECCKTYTQACSIAIESGALCCQVPEERTIPEHSVYIELSGMRLFFQEKKIAIPKHLIGKDPLECEAFADWIIETMISEGNLFAWHVLRKELNNQLEVDL